MRLPAIDFTDDRANHRTNEQADQAEEQSDQRPQNRAKRSPFRCAEIFRAEIASENIEPVPSRASAAPAQ